MISSHRLVTLASTLALYLAFAPAARAAGDTLTLKNHGKDVRTLTLAELTQLVPPETVRTHEFHEDKENLYKGVPMSALLTKVYGDAWKKADEVLFTCADGYQPSIPVAKFRDHPGYLAVGRADQDAFTMVNKLQNGEKIDLAPYYLVWDNLKDKPLQEDGASDQPYQVVAIDLIDFDAKFPGMAPPKGVSAQAHRGFLVFRKYCVACHSINGEGGAKSIELNYPVNVTEYVRENYLKQWIDKPQSIRFNATMPPLNPTAKNRSASIEDVLAYLKAMAKKKVAPKEP
jgi:hypothetical protein